MVKFNVITLNTRNKKEKEIINYIISKIPKKVYLFTIFEEFNFDFYENTLDKMFEISKEFQCILSKRELKVFHLSENIRGYIFIYINPNILIEIKENNLKIEVK